MHSHALTCTDVRWVEVVIGQLQRVIVAEFTQDGPGGFMTSPLDKESVQEQETYGKHTNTCESVSDHH